MPNLQSSFIFTYDELHFLISGFCDTTHCDELRASLLNEYKPPTGSGEASLKKKGLLDDNGRVEPVVSYLFRQISSAEQVDKGDNKLTLQCREISIVFERYHNAANMYRLTPLRKTHDTEEKING